MTLRPLLARTLLKPRAFSSSPSRAAPISHTLSVTQSRNNIHLTFSNTQGPVFATVTAGTGKTFKGAARSTFEAAHQASIKLFQRVEQYRENANGDRNLVSNGSVVIALNGYSGQGVEAFTQALVGPDGDGFRKLVSRVEDRTGIKIGGTRPRKPRRL